MDSQPGLARPGGGRRRSLAPRQDGDDEARPGRGLPGALGAPTTISGKTLVLWPGPAAGGLAGRPQPRAPAFIRSLAAPACSMPLVLAPLSPVLTGMGIGWGGREEQNEPNVTTSLLEPEIIGVRLRGAPP